MDSCDKVNSRVATLIKTRKYRKRWRGILITGVREEKGIYGRCKKNVLEREREKSAGYRVGEGRGAVKEVVSQC